MGFFKRFTRPRAKLSLKTEKHELVLGEEVKGIVEIKSEEEFDIEGITVSLNCSESVKKTRMRSETNKEGEKEWHEEEYWDRATLFSKSLKVCNEMHIPIGFSKEFSFAIQLPLIGRETYHSVDKNLQWHVWTDMKTRGRRSTRTACEILVAKPLVLSKEIVREVVLIPCSYCGGLMPQTSTFCPNCGARRKT
jgi:hypothetical protein